MYTGLHFWKLWKISSFDSGPRYGDGKFYNPDLVTKYLEKILKGKKEFREYKYKKSDKRAEKRIRESSLSNGKRWLSHAYKTLAYACSSRSINGEIYLEGDPWKESWIMFNERGVRNRNLKLVANEEDLKNAMTYLHKSTDWL